MWRLIPPVRASGAMQMAIDYWLLEQHRQGKQPSSLRFYTWSPIAISLGYHQHRYPETWSQLQWQGKPVELVRRPTGGRGVLHQGDLTYALVTSNLGGKRWQIYQYLSEFLIRGWQSLGLELHYGHSQRGYIHNPSCFGTATGADLVSPAGDKLIGSAQLRQGKAILQHGSMLLTTDAQLFERVFARSRFGSNISQLLPQPEAELQIKAIAALTKAARDCLQIQLQVQPLSPLEWQQISLVKKRFQPHQSSYSMRSE